MANVHRIGDYRNQRDELPGPRGGSLHPNPNELRFIDMLCPGFKWKHTIIWISAVQVIIFIASLAYGFMPGLKPSSQALITFGGAYGPLISTGEVWRYFTPIFLHADPFHILFNVFFQIRMGLPLEEKFGVGRFLALYFVAGIIGNIFSTAITFCTLKVGASTSGFGLIGAQFAEVALTWHMITDRSRVVSNLVFFVLIIVLFSFGIPYLDIWGHLGGALGGFFVTMLISDRMDNRPDWYMKGRMFAVASLLAIVVGCATKVFVSPDKC